jgi:hypothetical protein
MVITAASPVQVHRAATTELAATSGASASPCRLVSASWLGHYATRPEIRDTGQWNIDHVDDSYEAEFLQRLAQRVGQQ